MSATRLPADPAPSVAGLRTLGTGSNQALPGDTSLSAGASLPGDLSLHDYGVVVGDEVGAAFNLAKLDLPNHAGSYGGRIRLGAGTYTTNVPLVIPDRTGFESIAAARGSTTILAGTLFPHTTLNSGSPVAVTASSIPYNDNSTMVNAPDSGTIHVMASGVRVDITYTGINRTTHNFTGCTTNGTGNMANNDIIGFPFVCGENTVTNTLGAYGCYAKGIYFDCSTDGTSANAIPGNVSYYSDRIEEDSGLIDCLLRNGYHGGIVVGVRSTTGQHAQNYRIQGCTYLIASTAPVGAVAFDLDGNGSICRGIDDLTCNVVGVVDRLSSTAIRLTNFSGRFSRINIEHHQYGIYVDNSASTNRAVTIQDVSAGQSVTTLVRIGATTSNCTVNIASLSRYGLTTNLIQDDTRGGLLITDNTLSTYSVGMPNVTTHKRTYITNSPSSASVFNNGLVPPTKAGGFLDADFTNPENGMLGINTNTGFLEARVDGAWGVAAPPLPTTIYTPTLSEASRERVLTIEATGTIGATGTDAPDFYVPVPDLMVLRRMKVTCKTGPAGAMSVQLRKSSDGGSSWADVSGFTATFSAGAHTAIVDPTDVNVNEDDLLGVSWATGGSTVNMRVDVITAARDTPSWTKNVGTYATTGGASSAVLTTNADVLAGQQIIVLVSIGGVSIGLSSIADSVGLTWRIDKSQTNANGHDIAIARAVAPSGLPAGTTITATLSGSSGKLGMTADAWWGLADSAALTTTGNSGTGTSLTSTALSAVTQPALYLAAFTLGPGSVAAAGWIPESGWTQLTSYAYDALTGTFFTLISEYLSTKASGTYTATATFTAGSGLDYTGACVALAAG